MEITTIFYLDPEVNALSGRNIMCFCEIAEANPEKALEEFQSKNDYEVIGIAKDHLKNVYWFSSKTKKFVFNLTGRTS